MSRLIILLTFTSLSFFSAASESMKGDPNKNKCQGLLKLVISNPQNPPQVTREATKLFPPRKLTPSPHFNYQKVVMSFELAKEQVMEKMYDDEDLGASRWKTLFRSADQVATATLSTIRKDPHSDDAILAVPPLLRYLQLKMSVWNLLVANGQKADFLLFTKNKLTKTLDPDRPDLVDQITYLYPLRMQHILDHGVDLQELSDILPTTMPISSAMIPRDWMLAKETLNTPLSPFTIQGFAKNFIPLAGDFLFYFLPNTFQDHPTTTLLARFSILENIREYVDRHLIALAKINQIKYDRTIYLHPEKFSTLFADEHYDKLQELISLVNEFYYLHDISLEEVLLIFQKADFQTNPKIRRLIQSVLRTYRDEGFLQPAQQSQIHELQKKKRLPPYYDSGWHHVG